MNDRVLAKNKTSVTPPQATPASSPLLRRQLTSEVSESVDSNSNISKEVGGIQPKTIRRSLNWQNITVEAPHRSSASSTSPGGIQRLETSDVKEQEESKEQHNKELVQTTLTVGAPGDKYEQEADSMAAKVMRMPDSAIQQPIQRQTGEETEAVQMQPLVNSITPGVQRESGEEEEVQMKSEVQRASDGSSVASGSVENQLAGSKGGGSPLPDDVRSYMEPRFGADFSSVRVHTDSNAVQMNKELGAQAFAHGSDIYYGAGKSPGKNELTAHELTHTIQQTGAAQLNKSVLPKPEPEQEEKQPLQAKKLSSSTPEVIQNKLGTGIAPRIQANQQRQSTEPSQFSTTQSESIPLQGAPKSEESIEAPTRENKLLLALSNALGPLSQEKEDDAINDRLNLDNDEKEKLVQSAGSWNQVKKNYLSATNLMTAIIAYRKTEVKNITDTVFDSPKFSKELVTVEVGEEGDYQEKVRSNPTEVIAPGSDDLTSDYDITFAAGAGNENLEMLAVIEFNKLFREKWDLESGIVFDTNVYTTGHMRSPAFKGDVKKLYVMKDLWKIIDEIQEEKYPPKKKNLVRKFNEVRETFNKLKCEGVKKNTVYLPPLQTDNLREIRNKMDRVQRGLRKVVSQEYQNSKESYGSGPDFDELAMVMSLVHMKEFWEKQPDNANWTYFEDRMKGEVVPENGEEVPANVKEGNTKRLRQAGEIHKELVDERTLKIEELKKGNDKLAGNEENLQMMANNLLYEKYLQQINEKLPEIDKAKRSGEDPEVVKALQLELQELQSKAMFFANEAYMTAIAAEQVVLNQQLDLGLKLPTAQYLASIIEQTTFVGEQIAHIISDNNFGRALWKTSKYLVRIVSAIETISKQITAISDQTTEQVPSQDIMQKVKDLKPLVDKLSDIKKNKENNDKKDADAQELAKAKTQVPGRNDKNNSDVLGTNITGLARNILNLVSDVSIDVQKYLISHATQNQ